MDISTIIEIVLLVLGSGGTGILLEKFAPIWLRNLKIGSRSKEFLLIIQEAQDSNSSLLEFAKKEGLRYAAEMIEKHLDTEEK